MLLLALAACGFDNLPDQDWTSIDGTLWDPYSAVSTIDGVYVSMPHSGGLTLVRPGGTFAPVDLGEVAVGKLTLAPDQATVAVSTRRYGCKASDDLEVGSTLDLDACPDADRVVHHALAAVEDGAMLTEIALEGPYESLRWSSDSRFAAAWPDASALGEAGGVVNLTSVVILDTATGTANTIPVGFAASEVLFDASGQRAVVLSHSSVAVLDLSVSPPVRDVTFPLTLDPDQVVTPVGVSLTPDGQYALISTANASDLYVLDLVNHAVNMVSLSGIPAAMYVDPTLNQTMLVYANSAKADVVDHERFDVETVTLDEPMTAIAGGESVAVFSASGRRDVYSFDGATGELVEFRLQSPLTRLEVAPTEQFAIAFTTGDGYGGRPGMEILDLRDGEGHSFPYLLEGRGLGLAFDAFGESLNALILQQGAEYVYALDLYSAESEELDLALAPLALGSLPTGGFFVTHDAPLGLISFLDATTGEVTVAEGFAAHNLLERIQATVEE
jgi:hypothetical protein